MVKLGQKKSPVKLICVIYVLGWGWIVFTMAANASAYSVLMVGFTVVTSIVDVESRWQDALAAAGAEAGCG